MQSIMRLEENGMTPDGGEVLVTGAGGGVGSVAVVLLARRGYQVAAATGRPEVAEYLTGLGASRIGPVGLAVIRVAKELAVVTVAVEPNAVDAFARPDHR